MNVIVYCSDEGCSEIIKKAEENGRTIVEKFIETELKNIIDHRVTFKETISFIRGFKINKPITEHIKELWISDKSFLSNEIEMVGYITIVLRKMGVNIVTLSDEIKEINEETEAMREDYEIYSWERMAGIKSRLQDQKIMSRPPFGYKLDESGSIIVDENLRETIIQIFQMFEDNIPMSRISRRFNIPRSTLAYIRKNQIYTTGKYYWKGKVVFEVEPIVIEFNSEPEVFKDEFFRR